MENHRNSFQHCHDSLWRVELALASLTAKPAESCGSLAESCGSLAESCGVLAESCGELRATCEELRATCEELREPAVVCSKVLPPLGKSFSSLGKLSNTLFIPFLSRVEVVL
jgi:hypothetical protein